MAWYVGNKVEFPNTYQQKIVTDLTGHPVINYSSCNKLFRWSKISNNHQGVAAAGGMLGGFMDVVKDASSSVIPGGGGGSSATAKLAARTSTSTATTRPGMPQVSSSQQQT